MARTKFPVLATLILIFGLAWLIEEGLHLNIDIPWLPVIVVVVAIGMIFNRYKR